MRVRNAGLMRFNPRVGKAMCVLLMALGVVMVLRSLG